MLQGKLLGKFTGHLPDNYRGTSSFPIIYRTIYTIKKKTLINEWGEGNKNSLGKTINY